MKVSKHHYALELAKTGAKVFFIEPPMLSNKGITLSSCSEHAGITIVKYKPVFRGKRFLPYWLYRCLLYIQVKLLLKKIAVKPDIIWSFHGYLFENLQWFNAPVSLFFAADQFEGGDLPQEIKTADLLLAVSDTIKAKLEKSGKKVFQVNHGLQEDFVLKANELLQSPNAVEPAKKIIVGYTGNLRMQALDRTTMMTVIKNHPSIQFLFWGSYKKEDMNLGGEMTDNADSFITFLQNALNVELRGVVPGNILQQQLSACNLLWLCWKTGVHAMWDGSNSHKLLEYLSTGSPVVAHYVSSYKQTDLLYMLPEPGNENYPELFDRVITVLQQGEPVERVTKRLEFAVTNSYEKQLQRIGTYICGIHKAEQ
ncbi:MAG: glycosyltransferase family 4 protein [Chitinophagaceae bacterium]|nr:glycosyltransferase family 4 protein [Chitinophagaceae bacterium]